MRVEQSEEEQERVEQQRRAYDRIVAVQEQLKEFGSDLGDYNTYEEAKEMASACQVAALMDQE